MARVHARHRGACQDLLRGLRACNVAVGNLASVGHVTTALNGRHPATTCRRAHGLTWEALRFALLCWPHVIKIRVRLQHATTHVAREFGHARRRCAQAIANPRQQRTKHSVAEGRRRALRVSIQRMNCSHSNDTAGGTPPSSGVCLVKANLRTSPAFAGCSPSYTDCARTRPGDGSSSSYNTRFGVKSSLAQRRLSGTQTEPPTVQAHGATYCARATACCNSSTVCSPGCQNGCRPVTSMNIVTPAAHTSAGLPAKPPK